MQYPNNYQIDFTSVTPQFAGGSSKMPLGQYHATIVNIEIKQATTGKGLRANFEWQILDGPHAGKSGSSGENIAHQSEMAEKIGREAVAGIAARAGVPASAISTSLAPLKNARVALNVYAKGEDIIVRALPLGKEPDLNAVPEPATQQATQQATSGSAWGSSMPAQEAPPAQQWTQQAAQQAPAAQASQPANNAWQNPQAEQQPAQQNGNAWQQQTGQQAQQANNGPFAGGGGFLG